MTRDDAMRLLGIDQEGSDSGAVEGAYASLAAGAARRVASTPASALREKYRQEAERLRRARDLLLGDARPRNDPAPLSLTKPLDLPARAPIATGPTGPGAAEPPGGHPLTQTRQADRLARAPVGTGPGRSEPGGPDGVAIEAVGIIPGQVLADRYEVRAHLGSGGIGQVFAVFDRLRQQEIAVKVLLPHLIADPKARERFLNEARIASRLSHPNIVRVFDVQQAAGLTSLTMELLHGRSLREEIVRRQQTAQRFSVAEVVSIAQSLCAALQYAHGLTEHRDVKPENIWLGEDGSVKLMDFGIARLLRPSQFTSTALALGTAYEMALEQLRGQEADYRADQFAMAVVMYELLTGAVPQGAIKPPHQLRRSVPAGTSQAVMRAMEARPEARHADMAAFGRALAARSGSGIGARAVIAAAVALLLGAIVTLASRDAKKAAGGIAEQVAELWLWHPRSGEWFSQAEWRTNAREALESIATTCAAVQKQLDEFPADSTGLLGSWPHRLTGAVRNKLLHGNGEEGLAEARRLAGLLPEFRGLLAQRRGVVEAAREARDAARSDELQPRYQSAEDRLQAADDALVKDRLVDAGRIYSEAADAFRAVLVALNEHIDALLARGKADLNAERFAAAAERLQAVRKIRPGDATAGQLARRAEIGLIARVKNHDQAGEREEALSALVELRKLALDDADVRVLVGEHVDALLAKGKEELAAERFDTALQDVKWIVKLRPGDATATLAMLDNLRKLAPDDAGVKALRDSIYDPRRAITNTIGMKLELIPAGEFMMGSTHDDKDASDAEKPQHHVRITRPFYLGATEVTRGQFRRFVDDAGYRTEAEKDDIGGFGRTEAGNFVYDPKYTWQNLGFDQTDEHPVINVSWNDAVAFAAWLSRKEGTTYRLPTEAEWEYACRAGTTTRYSSGDDPESLATVGNVADGTAREKLPNWYPDLTRTIAARDGFVYTAPVGRFNPNAWGLFDMHGNVCEWCSDRYGADYYRRSPVEDPQGLEGASGRVNRGGEWFHEPRFVRSAYREGFNPVSRGFDLGFRLARVQSVR